MILGEVAFYGGGQSLERDSSHELSVAEALSSLGNECCSTEKKDLEGTIQRPRQSTPDAFRSTCFIYVLGTPHMRF